MSKGPSVPMTPDGRYILVRGRLWRSSNPHLSEARRHTLVRALMTARRMLAQRDVSSVDADRAHRAVDQIKRWLGERGPVWWQDGSPDLNRKMARHTVYASWEASLQVEDPVEDPASSRENSDE